MDLEKDLEKIMDLEKTINNSIDSGTMNRETHDKILNQIQSDGIIDEHEKSLLSKLFKAVQSGSIVLNDEITLPNAYKINSNEGSKLEALKKEAINRSSIKKTQNLEVSSKNELPKKQKEIEEIIKTTPTIQNTNEIKNKNPSQIAQNKREDGKTFILKNDRILDVSLNGMSWIKTGSMIGYYGSIKFTREGVFEHGIAKTIKKAVTKEGTSLTRASGLGNLFLADQGRKISLLDLGSYSLVVNGENLLAFEDHIDWDITWLKQLAAYAKGGMFNVRLSGKGSVAITTLGDPLVLKVSPNEPLMTDIQATVAWSGGLSPQFKTDISSETFIGRTSGESLQMKFEGDGFVIIQPFEE